MGDVVALLMVLAIFVVALGGLAWLASRVRAAVVAAITHSWGLSMRCGIQALSGLATRPVTNSPKETHDGCYIWR